MRAAQVGKLNLAEPNCTGTIADRQSMIVFWVHPDIANEMHQHTLRRCSYLGNVMITFNRDQISALIFSEHLRNQRNRTAPFGRHRNAGVARQRHFRGSDEQATIGNVMHCLHDAPVYQLPNKLRCPKLEFEIDRRR